MINKRMKSPKNYKSQEGKYGSVDKSTKEVNKDLELKKGIKVEKEHADTIKKIASGEIKPKDAPAAIAKDHIAESKTYYKDLEKVENKDKNIEIQKTSEPDFEETFKTIQKRVIVPILMQNGYDNVELPEGLNPNMTIRFEKKMFNENISNTGEITLSRIENTNTIIIEGNISIKVDGDDAPHNITIYRDIELSDDWDLEGLKHNLEESFVDAKKVIEIVVEQLQIKQNELKNQETTVQEDKPERAGVIVRNWSEVPSAWKNIDTIKKVNYSNTPYNKDLIKLLLPFSGNDELRSILQGVNFDDNGITVTNAHILIHLPYPNSDYFGTYNTFPKKKFLSDELVKIKNDLFPKDTKYPDVSKVIPTADSNKAYKVSLYKLLQYVQVATKYANPVTKMAASSRFNERVNWKKSNIFTN